MRSCLVHVPPITAATEEARETEIRVLHSRGLGGNSVSRDVLGAGVIEE